MWEHHRLTVYGKAVAANIAVDAIARAMKGRPDLRAQLQRAASSIVLNIAEGASEYSLADKARLYRIARRSAAECDAVLDLAVALIRPPPNVDEARALLAEVGAMLTTMIKRTPARE